MERHPAVIDDGEGVLDGRTFALAEAVGPEAEVVELEAAPGLDVAAEDGRTIDGTAVELGGGIRSHDRAFVREALHDDVRRIDVVEDHVA